MNKSIEIRKATEADLPSITQLFTNTILHVNAVDYSQKQLHTWGSFATNIDTWLKKVRDDYFIVAINHNIITGFASLTNTGEVDNMYVHKDFQRLGIASALLHHMELKAIILGFNELTTDASITAYPFFLKQGFTITEEYIKQRNGVDFLNRKMKKFLKPG
jgi:putative acetyltransferase